MKEKREIIRGNRLAEGFLEYLTKIFRVFYYY